MYKLTPEKLREFAGSLILLAMLVGFSFHYFNQVLIVVLYFILIQLERIRMYIRPTHPHR